MFHLVYLSSAIAPFSKSELGDIVEKSRINNAAIDITGLLLYEEGSIIQALEGEEEAVRGLFEKVKHDPRHRGIITVLEQTVPEREFPDWSMGFHDLSEEALPATSRAHRLLEMFRRTNGGSQVGRVQGRRS